MSDKKIKAPLIVTAGPTACGKSSAAAELAGRIGGEVISADSMQVYRHMDICSAKITKEEEMGIPHYMIDVAEPGEEFDVVRYAGEAKEHVLDIQSRGKIPILCGGTGFYIQAVVRDIDFEETGSLPEFRSRMKAFAEENGAEALHEKLRQADPLSAEAIHPHNLKRVIRALEYHEETGRSIALHNEEEKNRPSPYDLTYFVLYDDREEMYRRIDRRVDFMMEEGLMDEVRYLLSMGCRRDMVSMQGLGYKEMIDALEGRTTEEEAIRILKRDTRHYAKRQLTWFRREKDAIWISASAFSHDGGKIAAKMEQLWLESRKAKT